MLQELMNMEGVAVLSKEQQSAIIGGDACRLTTIDSNGNQTRWIQATFSDNEQGQVSAAQAGCGRLLNDPDEDVQRCFYDCPHDGWQTT